MINWDLFWIEVGYAICLFGLELSISLMRLMLLYRKENGNGIWKGIDT